MCHSCHVGCVILWCVVSRYGIEKMRPLDGRLKHQIDRWGGCAWNFCVMQIVVFYVVL